MKLIDFIDFVEIYKQIKNNHLENYPSAKDYIEELKSFAEPYDYVEEMYNFFENFPEDAQISDEFSDCDCIDIENKTLTFEWFVGGNNATESGDDYWGYGWTFTVDLDTELFIGFSYDNYS